MCISTFHIIITWLKSRKMQYLPVFRTPVLTVEQASLETYVQSNNSGMFTHFWLVNSKTVLFTDSVCALSSLHNFFAYTWDTHTKACKFACKWNDKNYTADLPCSWVWALRLHLLVEQLSWQTSGSAVYVSRSFVASLAKVCEVT